jgi:preprotein translocase subunit Sec61beta
MAEDRINLPSGMGGLMRYFDEYKSKIQIKPAHVIVLIAIFIIIEIIIRL